MIKLLNHSFFQGKRNLLYFPLLNHHNKKALFIYLILAFSGIRLGKWYPSQPLSTVFSWYGHKHKQMGLFLSVWERKTFWYRLGMFQNVVSIKQRVVLQICFLYIFQIALNHKPFFAKNFWKANILIILYVLDQIHNSHIRFHYDWFGSAV